MKYETSVIIPTYNRPEKLGKALLSVLNQVNENFEVIVINDNTDEKKYYETKKVIDNFNDDRIRHIKNNFANGSANARNTGMMHSQGDYIAFLDDDDTWEKNKLSEQLNFMNKNMNIGICGTNSNHITLDESLKGLYRYPEHQPEILKALLYTVPILNSASLFRKEIFKTIGLQNNKFSLAQDYEWIFRVLASYQGYNIQEYLTNYTRDETSSCHKNVFATRLTALRIFSQLGKDRDDYILGLGLKTIGLIIPSGLSGTGKGTKIMQKIFNT